MEIILKQDVKGLGHKDDVVSVKNGYARNFLIPQGFASLATVQAKKIHTEVLKQRAHKEEKLRAAAKLTVEKLKTVTVTVGAKTSSTGKIFGSVTNIQIAEALEKLGYTVDRKNITIIEDHIKEVGKYKANVKIYKELQTEVVFEVVSE